MSCTKWQVGGCGIVTIALGAWGCAQGDVGEETEGAAALVGDGGQGVGGGGGGEPDNSCGVDCSTIETDQCHEGVCNEETLACAIVPVTDGTGCDDELFCTVDDTCQAGTCQGGPANDCGMTAETCQQVVCTEATQSCTTQPQPDGAYCTSTNLCQINTQCQNGQCSGSQKDCLFSPVPNECYVSTCDPQTGDCVPEPGHFGEPCIDPAELCMVDKVCDNAGSCIGGQDKDCSGLTQGCYNGECDDVTGNCVQVPVPVGDPCLEAADDCNNGICDNAGLCQPVPTNEGGSCQDGNSCTQGESCASGQCTGGQVIPPVITFEEDFSDNSAGWTLGTEWAIGSAQASSGQSYGNADPANDHTATADNGVAGVVIGGNAATASTHSFYYLTSPVINTAGLSPLYLGFWRWLNSDYAPYMSNIVEVYDGVQWQVVWQSDYPAVLDAAWTQQILDIAAYANANLQVRFGFEIGSSGVFTVSSWNLDDVVIADAICP